jgi:FkbM family methyltransferase
MRQRLSRWLWRRHGLTWQLPSGLHARVESLGEWAVYNEIFVDRAYDGAIEPALTAGVERPRAIIDVGAHVGYFSLRVAERVRQLAPTIRATITMVEGHPDTFATLAERLRQQPFDATTEVRLVHGLAGMRTGTARIAADAFAAASHIVDDGTRGRTVPFVDLESLAPPTGPIDLFKCDIEGAEAQVIAEYPALLSRVQYAAFEFHPRRVDVEALVRQLAAVGLRQTQVVSDTPDGSLRLFAR